MREFTATVTAMETEQRLISLQDETGRSTTIHEGLKRGDLVTVTYYTEALAISVRPTAAL